MTGRLPSRGGMFRAGLLIGSTIGASAAAAIYRRQAMAIIASMRPYERRTTKVDRPVLIVNRRSGGGKAERFGLLGATDERDIETVMLEQGDDLAGLAADAVERGADAIGMAGGDGSLGLVAGVAAKHDLPFFCVPIGTRNHFALDLGLDRDDPLAALDVLQDGVEIRIDHGLVGDRVFLNNVSLGLYPTAVKQDGYRDNRVGTLLSTAISTEREAQPDLTFRTPDGVGHQTSTVVLVSNNRYMMAGPPDYGRRVRLDTGRLGVVAMMDHDADQPDNGGSDNATFAEWMVEEFRVDSDAEMVDVAIDGESIPLPPPIEVVSKPRGLGVLVPAGTRPGGLPPLKRVTTSADNVAELGGVSDS